MLAQARPTMLAFRLYSNNVFAELDWRYQFLNFNFPRLRVSTAQSLHVRRIDNWRVKAGL